MRLRPYNCALVLVLLVGCVGGAKDGFRSNQTSITPTTVTLAAPLSSLPPVTTTTVVRPKLDPLQVVGAWVVTEAGPAALIPQGARVDINSDGLFHVSGANSAKSGSWAISDGELLLTSQGRTYGYAVVAGPRQLVLTSSFGAGMIFDRV